MKTYLLISVLFIALVSCKNSGTNVTEKSSPLYDTVPKYDKVTGAHIGDTIVTVASEKNMNFGNGDTVPVYQNGIHIGDTILSSQKFIRIKEKK